MCGAGARSSAGGCAPSWRASPKPAGAWEGAEREREIVRGRLRAIEARMAEAGEIGEGPGHDALGRGLLALGEPRAALEHFRAAERAGYRSPGLDYAMGVALSALYKQALDGTK